MFVLDDNQYRLLAAAVTRIIGMIREGWEAAPLVVINGNELESFCLVGERDQAIKQAFCLGVYAQGKEASEIVIAADMAAGSKANMDIAPVDDPAHMQGVQGMMYVRGKGFYPGALTVPYFRADFGKILPAEEGWKESTTGRFMAYWEEIRPADDGMISVLEKGYTTTEYQIPTREVLEELGCMEIPKELVLDALEGFEFG